MRFRFWRAWRERDEACTALEGVIEDLENTQDSLRLANAAHAGAEALAAERLSNLEHVYTELFQANKSRDEAVKQVMELAGLVSPSTQAIPDIKNFKPIPRLTSRRPDRWLGPDFVATHEKALQGLEAPAPSAEDSAPIELN